MAQFDIESFRDHFLSLLQDNMVAKVAEINTEKGDSLLSAPANTSYINSFNDTVINLNEFVYYKIKSIETVDSHAGGISRRITMMFVFFLSSPDDWGIAESKILRYTRACEEIISSNARKESRISDLEINVFEPDMVSFSENSPWMQAGGIQVSGVITT